MTQNMKKPTAPEKYPKVETNNKRGNCTKLTEPEVLDRARMSEAAERHLGKQSHECATTQKHNKHKKTRKKRTTHQKRTKQKCTSS
jgi:hypothetical protein